MLVVRPRTSGRAATTAIAAALGLTRDLRALLFEASPTDASTFAIAILVVIAAGLAGCVIPAVSASRVDPAVALKYE